MFIGNNTSIITPCIGSCQLDEHAICKGCYRTSEEIADWINKTEDEKISIVIRCKKQIAKQVEHNSEGI
ncbi:DUF1289 domain-containing protein [Vibrio hannami]|uniref:DUF1289 domain-containing protein n=1 Tax=Vibrio hannami TaxID=2717094 RepID=UPI003BB05B35